MIKPGIYKDMDMKEYHGSTFLSRSDIVRLCQSPAWYRNYKDEDSPAYRFGRAFHGLVLENIPIVINSSDGRSKIGKEFQTVYPDALSSKDAATAQRMAEHAKPFFGDGQAEISFFWEEDGILCGCRPDWIQDGIIYDLKTTGRTLDDFHWDARKYFYDCQSVWYMRGVEQYMPVSTFRFIVVEKNPPFGVRTFEFEDLARGKEMVERGLNIYRQCTESGVWTLPIDTEVHLL